eukprot:Protomagalhaensia_sp_Gyna_25__5443@NODE_712_length_2795_cov_40_927068_g554_i0_p3_GENE_NODE_712_length_2795_cov_40_927068_g554_i0NODE_712_length_2795_cov_40_927068_g554_i0_p3_ORF_typecomplete_len222_score28_58SLC35F/PF06027_12/8_2e05CRTlike/PF08627_10/0_7_NODE_712_length_2795_cov_40_927068_g554_i013622027
MSSVLAVGIEGATGVGITAIVLPIFHWAKIENINVGFYQLSISSQLRMGMFWYAICSFLNNATGVVVTKWTSGLIRCIFMSMRPPAIWIMEMGLGWNRFDFYNLTAMVLLATGLAIHLMVPPFDGKGYVRELLLREVPCECLTGSKATERPPRRQSLSGSSPASELIKFGSSPTQTDVSTVGEGTPSPFAGKNVYITDWENSSSILPDEESSRLSEHIEFS